MSLEPARTTAPPPADTRPRITVLSGFSPPATRAVAARLLAEDPALVLVEHDITRIRHGLVRRVVRDQRHVLEDTTVALVHGCVSCTLHDDVLPTLIRLGHGRRDVLLVLPPVIEPEDVADACDHPALRFDSYVTVLDTADFLDDLSTDDDLRDRDLHAADDDSRAVAQVVARQVEFADTVVVWGRPEADRVTATARLLVPWATVVAVPDTDGTAELTRRLRRTGRHDPDAPGMIGRALESMPIGVHDPHGSCGVSAMLFDSRRPFHAGRLHEALPEITTGTLRGRGQMWIASQPDIAVGWESAGQGISLGTLGRWLDALPAQRWSEVSALRRLTADVTWDPYYGDRRTALAFVGLGMDTADLHDRLAGCLLSDVELAAGADTWSALPDPFAGCFPDSP
ncbi:MULTISPECIES: GTP-binding protein [Actinoplanes]|uniref:CobW family GTP-binding protein n=1 Tax=Actinoplanes TaxID=1865 RepID=UPI0005F2E96F|nr:MULTISPECIES: GTP-binding protein [Actinoplanes]GLY02691.1 cobalamin biosynthesis protein CobW [Actinoplanes sp. NBRC 101535]